MHPSIQQFAGNLQVSEIRHILQAHNLFQERFHTAFPLTQVLTTYPSLSNTVKSASAPGLSVPFRFSIPRHLDESFKHMFGAIGLKQSPCRVESGALDRLAQRASRKLDKVPDTSVQGDDTPGEGGGSLKVQFDAFLHKPLPLSPLVNTVLQVRIQDLHGYPHGLEPALPITSFTWGTYHP